MSSKSSRTLAGAGLAALVAAVGVQSYYLDRLDQRLERSSPMPERTSGPRKTGPSSPLASAQDPKSSRTRAPDDSTWDPIQEMESRRSRIDELFDDSLGRLDLEPGLTGLSIAPAKVTENGDEYVVRLDVPDADRSNLDVSLEGRSLKIEGDRKEEVRDEEPGNLLREESHGGHFEQRLALPGPVDSKTLTTDNADGVLTVRVHEG